MTRRAKTAPKGAALGAVQRLVGDAEYDAITTPEYTASATLYTPPHLYPRLVTRLCFCACHARYFAAGVPPPLLFSHCDVVNTLAAGPDSCPHVTPASVEAFKNGRVA